MDAKTGVKSSDCVHTSQSARAWSWRLPLIWGDSRCCCSPEGLLCAADAPTRFCHSIPSCRTPHWQTQTQTQGPLSGQAFCQTQQTHMGEMRPIKQGWGFCTRSPCWFAQRGAVCPWVTPLGLAASDTGSTWCWKRYCRNERPKIRENTCISASQVPHYNSYFPEYWCLVGGVFKLLNHSVLTPRQLSCLTD